MPKQEPSFALLAKHSEMPLGNYFADRGFCFEPSDASRFRFEPHTYRHFFVGGMVHAQFEFLANRVNAARQVWVETRQQLSEHTAKHGGNSAMPSPMPRPNSRQRLIRRCSRRSPNFKDRALQDEILRRVEAFAASGPVRMRIA
jgi:hypothetical protein